MFRICLTAAPRRPASFYPIAAQLNPTSFANAAFVLPVENVLDPLNGCFEIFDVDSDGLLDSGILKPIR